jgi:hypothetical protein
MKRFFIFFCLLFFTTRIFAQQFSQYNTGTLFDSFENPSQRSFIPDSSREFAFNFFIPNGDANFSLTGNAQQTLKNRAFNSQYNNQFLQIGSGDKFNYVNANVNAYVVMFKLFSSLSGNEELGFSAQFRGDGSGAFTDESLALFNGSASFKNDSYNNIFDSHYRYQIYNQFGFTYREEISKEFAFGIKLAYLYGIANQSVVVNQSHITFDKTADSASLSLSGTDRKTGLSNGNPFYNPGASVSIGTTYKTEDGFIIQANIKDLGFIHWNKYVKDYSFDDTQTIDSLTTSKRENNVYNAINNAITKGFALTSPYTTPIDGHAELSASKIFWLDDDYIVKYSPTLIASKELFYSGFTGALVNPVQYKNDVLTLTASYDDMMLFKFGAQFMIKSPNAEFFIGSDRIFQTGRMALAALKDQNQINETGNFTGADIFIGFSMKFGSVIEHPLNSNIIPMGTKGFIGRLWSHIFASSEE